MKILFLATWYPYPPNNGSKLRVSYLLKALAQKHDVTLIAFDFDTPDSASERWSDSDLAYVERIPIDPFAAARRGRLLSHFSLRSTAARIVPAMRSAVRRQLQGGGTDVMIASTFMCSAYALETPPSLVRILEEHNSLTRWMWDRYRQQTSPSQRLRCWLSWQKTRHFEARLFKHFDLVTAVSTQDASAMTMMLPGYPGPVEIVPNGVDCQHNRPEMDKRTDHTLIYNGALTYSANYDAMQYFLSAIFPLIRQSMPGVRLTITGSTDGVDLGKLALDDAVNFSGYVQDVRGPVTLAAVCVVPLRKGSGTRLKILEAMALGTPIVATSKGAEGLEVVSGTHLLLADTPEDFAKATITLLGDSALRATLATNARRLVEEKYDWQQIGARFVRLVEQAAALKQGSHTAK